MLLDLIMIWALGRSRDSSLESFEALERKLARFYSLNEYSIRFRCTGDTNWAWFSYFHLTTLHDISQIIEHSYNHLSFFLCSSLSLSLFFFFSFFCYIYVK